MHGPEVECDAPVPPTPAPETCTGPLNMTTQCANDFFAGGHSCPTAEQSICIGFVAGKSWGHCCTGPHGPYPAPTPPPTPGDAVHDVFMLLHHAPVGQFGEKSAWQAHNATIRDFPMHYEWEGNWNPAPVALPDGRVRVMAHTGFSGFFNKLAGWSGEVILEAPSWKGPYEMISSRDITNCTDCEEGAVGGAAV